MLRIKMIKIVVTKAVTGHCSLKKNSKDQTIPTKIIVSNLNVFKIYYHVLANIIFSGKAINKKLVNSNQNTWTKETN